MEKKLKNFLFERTAQRHERRLQRLLDDSRSNPSEREQLLEEFNLPKWAQGVKVESTFRGPFGYKVVATSNRGH